MDRCGIIACVFLCLLHSSIGDDNVTGNVTVTTPVGEIIGTTSVNASTFNGTKLTYTTFLGIPFAEPATGERRFSKPVTKPPFTERFLAVTPGDACPQNVDGSTSGATTFSEDCLNLNIFLPGVEIDATSRTAVMVYIYGGGFTNGYQDSYNSGTFAAMNDVILVTFNYRVNVFGFLASGDNDVWGNYGLWDQQMAIKWVHDNIAAFGGDVNRVTIFGVSAGAASVVYQAMYEGNDGLFQRVIAESGSANCPWAFQKSHRKHYSAFVSATGCDLEEHSDVMECLRNLSVDVILGLNGGLLSNFRPSVDGDFIKSPPNDVIGKTTTSAMEINNRLSRFNFLLGVASGEGGIHYQISPDGLGTQVARRGGNITEGVSRDMFRAVTLDLLTSYMDPTLDKYLVAESVLHEYIDWSDPNNKQNNRQRLYDSQGDFLFKAGIVATANAHSNSRTTGSGNVANAHSNYHASASGSLYFYEFDHRPSWSKLPEWFTGASHADEVGFVLGFYFLETDPVSVLPRLEVDLAKQMMTFWTNFGKTGNPNMAEIDANITEKSNANGKQKQKPKSGRHRDLPTWPPYDSDQQSYIVFTDDVTAFPVRKRPAARGVHFFNELPPRLTPRCQPAMCHPYSLEVSSNDVISGDQVSVGVFITLMTAVVTVALFSVPIFARH